MADDERSPETEDVESPAEASRRGLESLHDGKLHDEAVLPKHGSGPAGAPDPKDQHRGGPLPNEKK